MQGNGGNVTGGTGNAGNGGDSSVSIDLIGSDTTSSSMAAVGNSIGGNGGSVLNNGAIGSGGAGGFGLALAEATETSADTISVTLNASGGSGGQGVGQFNSAGGGGGAVVDPVNGSSAGGGVMVLTLGATGGNGGAGLTGASGGYGGFASINNAITASSSGPITLLATTTGGNGGTSAGGTGGSGGPASSEQTLSEPEFINATFSSYGGNGGYASTLDEVTPMNGGAGGTSTAFISIASGVYVTANANTGSTGTFSAGGGTDIGTGGAGGAASATAIGQSITGFSLPYSGATASSAGGAGGASLNGSGGAGGDSTASANASAASFAQIDADATLTGGNGGSGSGVGSSGGMGGMATATAVAVVPSAVIPGYAQAGDAQATATGGTGGQGNNLAATGNGGAATATATLTSPFSAATISQTVNASAGSPGKASVAAVWSGPGDPIGVSVGTSNQNIGSVTVTGLSAQIAGITGSGSLIVGDGVNATTLQLGTNTGGSTESSLTIQSNSTLDITNNHFIINYGSNPDPISMIRGYLTTGRAGGAWTGPGIDSSTAALPGNGHYALGYANGADGIVAGLSSGQIEIKYTLLGDADLDGAVTGSDFTILASNLGKSVSSWDKGDFDYDGVVSGSDFTALVENLGKSASGASVVLPASDYAAVDAFAEANGLMADVPEPGTLGLITIGALGTLLRRKRKNIHE
jgi:hypothetical protein